MTLLPRHRVNRSRQWYRCAAYDEPQASAEETARRGCDLRGTLRNLGLKVGVVSTGKFEARIRELVTGSR
jgi:hypothetical protein